ncbi:lipopolysaccharide heptosyltransferase I [Candidatus Pseudothioglobus singularis]|nr:lipopolysaccharide heptosyltransferase I [Candidatus Pseudothioglobus singularis]
MKIAIVKLSALGDIVHAMVVLQFIKKFNNKILVDWVVEESFKDLLEFHPDIHKLYTVKLKNAKKKKSFYLLYKELKRTQQFGPYDLVIDMQGLIKSALIARFIPSKITLGFEKSSTRESLASVFYNKVFKISYNKNVIERNFELIKYALDLPFNPEDLLSKLPFLHSDQRYINASLSDIKKNIILIPGASFASKQYPVENFAEVIHLLDANYFIVWGNDEEKLLADKIKHLAPHVNICEKLSIESLISLVYQIDLIIGPDTGPTHIGWALNIPSITIFGPTPGYRNTLVTAKNKIIESESDVNPNRINKNDYSISGINAIKVVEIAKSLL